MKKPDDIKRILEVIVDLACEFLNNEIGIVVERTSLESPNRQGFGLKPYTTLMSISGCFSINITFSFDSQLIKQIYQVYCRELDIDDSDRLEYIDETAADMINIVIGNSTAQLAQDGTTMIISVPVVINEANPLVIPDFGILTTSVFTAYGDMMITAMPNSQQISI